MGWYLLRSSTSTAEPCAAARWKWRTSFCRSNRADLSGLVSQTATSPFFCALAADETSASIATSRPALPIDVMRSPRGRSLRQGVARNSPPVLNHEALCVLPRKPEDFRSDLLECGIHGIRVGGPKCLALDPSGEWSGAERIVGDQLQQHHIRGLAATRTVIETDREDDGLAQVQQRRIELVRLSGLIPKYLVPDLPGLMGSGLPRSQADLATVCGFRRIVGRATALIAIEVSKLV